jgi:hypothetical protein
MIVVTHRPSELGWDFTADTAGLSGGGRSLQESQEYAEHVVRTYLSLLRGGPVALDDVHARVRHVVEDVAPEALLAHAA